MVFQERNKSLGFIPMQGTVAAVGKKEVVLWVLNVLDVFIPFPISMSAKGKDYCEASSEKTKQRNSQSALRTGCSATMEIA